MGIRIKSGQGVLRVIRGGVDALWSLKAEPGLGALETYEPVSDFTLAANPNGVWTYGSLVGTVFTPADTTYLDATFSGWTVPGPFTWFIAWKNVSGSVVSGVAPGQLALHCKPDGNAGGIRFISPAAFPSLSVVGRFHAGDIATPTVSIRRAGTVLFSATDSGAFSLTLENIQEGEPLDFVVSGATFNTSTPIELTISGRPRR